ncbi:DnaT-like ssDNA-binding protein [Mesorhizobium opportunistum]|uniref:DnaT-like ssDNA-binding protein n=1 Tax=Mesorhizobium opportunistum TaxID=593909 RepID=UPI003CC90DDC
MVGSGIANAESYSSAANCAAYAHKEGKSFASSLAAAAEAALRRAIRRLEARYRSRFPGQRVKGRSQGLKWPRSDAYDPRLTRSPAMKFRMRSSMHAGNSPSSNWPIRAVWR